MFPLKYPLFSSQEVCVAEINPDGDISTNCYILKKLHIPFPDYLDELLSGTADPDTLDIESFVTRVALDAGARWSHRDVDPQG